jgi:hypothetical protein
MLSPERGSMAGGGGHACELSSSLSRPGRALRCQATVGASLLSGWVAMAIAGRQLCLAPSVRTLTNTHPCSPGKGGAGSGAGQGQILPVLSQIFLSLQHTHRDPTPSFCCLLFF